MPAVTTVPVPLTWAISLFNQFAPFWENRCESTPKSASLVVMDTGESYLYLHDEDGREIELLQHSSENSKCEVVVLDDNDERVMTLGVGTYENCLQYIRQAQPLPEGRSYAIRSCRSKRLLSFVY